MGRSHVSYQQYFYMTGKQFRCLPQTLAPGKSTKSQGHWIV